MATSMIVGRYIHIDSWIHDLDPRAKLMATFYFILLVFLAKNWWGYGLLLAFIFSAVALSKLSIKFFIQGLKPMLLIILFTVFFQLIFTQGGKVYFQWAFLSITSAGIESAVFIFFRLFLIIMISTLLTLSTSPLELTDGIEHLLRPLTRLGFPSHEVALMLSIALRYVPTLLDEAQSIMNAQRSRGVDFNEGNIMQRMKAVIPILVPLFVSAFNRAEELALAMEARGYKGAEGRTKYRQLDYEGKDLILLIMMILLTAVLLLLMRFT